MECSGRNQGIIGQNPSVPQVQLGTSLSLSLDLTYVPRIPLKMIRKFHEVMNFNMSFFFFGNHTLHLGLLNYFTQQQRIRSPRSHTKVCILKTNTDLKPTLYTTCIHLEAPNECMWYIVLVLGRCWFWVYLPQFDYLMLTTTSLDLTVLVTSHINVKNTIVIISFLVVQKSITGFHFLDVKL